MANDIHVTDGSILETLNNKVDLDGGNYPSSGLERYIDKTLNTRYDSKYLNRTQITNCLLEVPQNIKLELNNGILTLKAGSIITFPNGFEADGVTKKFDYLETHNDTSITSSNNDTWVIWVYSGGTLGARGLVAQTGSGETTPSNVHCLYYNTKDNKIYNVSPGGTLVADCSFPVCIVTATTNGITQIKQVFNSFGYIGSTIWIDKGVKGLIPNGRNEDGTLNNIEAQANTVVTITYTNDIKGVHFGFDMDGNPALNGLYRYDEKDNYVYNGEFKGPTMFCGTYDIVDGKVSNINPKQPFRAMEYSNESEIISWCMPDYSRATTWSTAGGVVPYDAKVILYNTDATNAGGSGGWVKVNGLLEYCVRGNAYEATSPVYVAYLPNGAVVETNNINFAYIVPLKGVK